MRNFVGGNLNILHCSDADPHGVIRAGVADKAKKYAKPIAEGQIGGCMALIITAGGSGSKDLSNLIYRLSRKRTDSVLGLLAPDGDDENDAALRMEHRTHTAEEMRSMRGALQTVKIRGQVNLIVRATKATVPRRPTQRAYGSFQQQSFDSRDISLSIKKTRGSARDHEGLARLFDRKIDLIDHVIDRFNNPEIPMNFENSETVTTVDAVGCPAGDHSDVRGCPKTPKEFPPGAT